MIEGKVYILHDVPIDLTMPDGSVVGFILEKPNSLDKPFWFEMTAEAPAGERIYKDPKRRKQKHFEDYYPVFHLNYAHHMMFTTYLLVADNIALKTAPGFEDTSNYITTNCLFLNESAVKNYKGIGALGAYSQQSEAKANPVKSGSTELVFGAKNPLTWQEALSYYYYQRMDSSELLVSSDDIISNEEIVIHN